MPPTRKFARQIKVNVSYFDWAFVEFLIWGSDEMLSDVMRTALRAYQADHPKLDRRAFMSWFEKQFVPERLTDASEAGAARREVESFFSSRDEDSLLTGDSILPPLESARGLEGDPTAPDDED